MKNVTSYDKNLIEDSIKSLKQKNLELDLKLKEYSSSIDMYKNNIMEKNLEIESIKSQIIKDKMQLEG